MFSLLFPPKAKKKKKSFSIPSALIFPSIRTFPMNFLCASDDKDSGASASASVLLVNIQDWFPLGWTGWISLQSEGPSGVFSNTTVQKHPFFCAQLSWWPSSYIHISWILVRLWHVSSSAISAGTHVCTHTPHHTTPIHVTPFCIGDVAGLR